MNSQPDQLSKLLLEADGLLLLLQRHRDETPVDAIKLLRKKLELILVLTEGLDEEPDESAETEAPAAVDESVDGHAEETESTGTYVEDTIENPGTQHQAETDSEVKAKNEERIEEVIEDDYKDDDEACAPVFIDDPQPVFIDSREEPTVFFADEPLQPEPEPQPEQESEPVADEEPEPQESDEQPVYHRTYIVNDNVETPGEQHTPRRPVSSVFNLNDKFRFRRELFGNSDAQYVECLDILSAMSSIDEAREYLFEDLKWDAANEDVKAFIELLANYYR